MPPVSNLVGRTQNLLSSKRRAGQKGRVRQPLKRNRGRDKDRSVIGKGHQEPLELKRRERSIGGEGKFRRDTEIQKGRKTCGATEQTRLLIMWGGGGGGEKLILKP